MVLLRCKFESVKSIQFYNVHKSLDIYNVWAQKQPLPSYNGWAQSYFLLKIFKLMNSCSSHVCAYSHFLFKIYGLLNSHLFHIVLELIVTSLSLFHLPTKSQILIGVQSWSGCGSVLCKWNANPIVIYPLLAWSRLDFSLQTLNGTPEIMETRELTTDLRKWKRLLFKILELI